MLKLGHIMNDNIVPIALSRRRVLAIEYEFLARLKFAHDAIVHLQHLGVCCLAKVY